jgi:hypothetical protein
LPPSWLFLKIKTDSKQRNTTSAAKNSSILHTLGLSKKSQIQLKHLFVSNFCGSTPSDGGGEEICGSFHTVNHSTGHSRFFITWMRFLFLAICCHNCTL